MAEAGFVFVRMNDEAPRIGSGRRVVFVEQVGRVWVTIRCPVTLAAGKITAARWKEICTDAREVKMTRAAIDRTVHCRKLRTTSKGEPVKMKKSERVAVRAMRKALGE